MAKKFLNIRGFTILEVLIALTIFAVFISVFVTSQGGNLADSVMIREEIKLRQLCEQKLNEIIANPPVFSESLTLTPETKTFESTSNDKDLENYEYTIEYKLFKIPDIEKITGEAAGSDYEGESAGLSGIQKSLMEQIKNNMEKLLWQVKVTITNKNTKFYFNLSTWLLNNDANVQFSSI